MTRRKVTRKQPPKPPVTPTDRLEQATRRAVRRAEQNPTHENVTAAFAHLLARRLLGDDKTDSGVATVDVLQPESNRDTP